jgi:hypothetical protein
MVSFEGSTLTYFDATGRAEVLRHALAHAGVKWTDKRIKYPVRASSVSVV